MKYSSVVSVALSLSLLTGCGTESASQPKVGNHEQVGAAKAGEKNVASPSVPEEKGPKFELHYSSNGKAAVVRGALTQIDGLFTDLSATSVAGYMDGEISFRFPLPESAIGDLNENISSVDYKCGFQSSAKAVLTRWFAHAIIEREGAKGFISVPANELQKVLSDCSEHVVGVYVGIYRIRDLSIVSGIRVRIQQASR